MISRECLSVYEVVHTAKARWVEMVEHADLADQDKWKIFCLLIGGDGRLEEVPGGLKVTLPPRQRH